METVLQNGLLKSVHITVLEKFDKFTSLKYLAVPDRARFGALPA